MKRLFIITILLLTGLTYSQSKMSVGIGGGLQLPSGLFSNYYGTGFNFEGGLDYELSTNFDLGLSLGFMNHSFSVENANKRFKELFGSNAPEFNEFDAKFSAFQIKVGGKYYFTPEGFRPYAMLEFGMNFLTRDTIKSSTSINGNPDKITVNQVESTSESVTGVGIGLGFLLPLSPKINLDVAAKYSFVGYEFNEEYRYTSGGSTTEIKNNETVAFFVIRAGIRFTL